MKRDIWLILRTMAGMLAFAGLYALAVEGCAASPGARPAAYESALLACNEWADTLRESIECEEKVRRKFGRPARDAGGQ